MTPRLRRAIAPSRHARSIMLIVQRCVIGPLARFLAQPTLLQLHTMTTQISSGEHVYDVVIAGGAIAGLACAVGLVQRGVTNVLVLDKASKMQPVGASIALFSNGIKALEYLSPAVTDKVKASCIPIETMILQDLEGNVLHEKKPPTKKGVQYLVWYLLQKYLAEGIPEDVIKMGTALESFEISSDGIVTLSTTSRRAASL